MKKLIILAVVAAAAAFCEAAPRKVAAMPVDESGWRCEGDCDSDTPCEFCNPKPKKSAAKSKRGEKAARKRSAAKSKSEAKPRKRSAKPKATGARKRSRRAVETTENEG